MKIAYANRKINYFELSPTYIQGSNMEDFISVFSLIKELQNSKNPERFFYNGEKTLYMTDIKFDDEHKQIRGKLLNIRMDIFPELIDTISNVVRDIEAAESEGVVETSHFVLSYKKDSLLLSFEFNQYGPRISDFTGFLSNKAQKLNAFEKLDYNPYSRDDLPKYKRRINRISTLIAKVHKDNYKRINDFDRELFDAFDTANKISESEYVTLDFKYGYHELKGSMKIRGKIMNIIDRLISDKTATNVFDTLKVKAEDEDHNNRIKEFDLLNIWVKSELKVEKKTKSRAIVSADIFQKMQDELQKEFGR
ncbi:MAG: hypothetical protein RBS73_14000 [Prolixibacteraceae bacterium]|jgi:hypothetical protein|nr:hypothetical protein [Prolixibacteraceae bacterium]